MPGEAILRALRKQGKELLSLCWQRLQPKMTGRLDRILRDCGVTDFGEQKLWIARLALPVLSKPEIEALFREMERARKQYMSPPHPTPLRFTFWVLAHRLGHDAQSLARKAAATKTAEYFEGRVNPIKEVCVE